jgi:predicted GNAT family acetyltransferase
VVATWLVAFAMEAGVTVESQPRAAIERRLASGGGITLWWVDSTPVAMAGRGPAVGGVPRIGPVWTAPQHRRRGYAAAVTAVVCNEAFDLGASACTLYADAANPTSNSVYRRLGFHEIGLVIDAKLTAPPVEREATRG